MEELLTKVDYKVPVTGIVVSVDPASCLVYLNTKGTKTGRLYKKDSRAFESSKPFDQLPEYQAGEKITAVLVSTKRQGNDQFLFYLNERWADYNPWEDLPLSKGDKIFGYISTAIPDFDSPIAYLVKLIHNKVNTPQPDIEVFLPVGEIPLLDGAPLQLNYGDSIQAVITNADMRPPRNPNVSIKQLRKENYHRQSEALKRARTAFVILGKDQFTSISKLDTPLIGKHLVLIDDEKSPIETFKRAAKRLGAIVSTIHWKRRLKDEDILDKLFDAAISKKCDPDIVIIDDTLGKPTTGLNLLERLKKRLPNWNFILASSFYTPETTSKLVANSRKKVAAIHKPVRLASLLEVLSNKAIPREFIQGAEPQLDIQELIYKAEIALSSAVGGSNKAEIMAFSIAAEDRLHGIGNSSHRLSKEDKAKWVNDPYFRILLQNKNDVLELNRGMHVIADTVLQKVSNDIPAKNFSQWHICKVESQNLLIGHCFNRPPRLPLELSQWMAEQLARRLWSWHWREAIAPTLALGQQAASIAHELVKYSDKATRRLEDLRTAYEKESEHSVITEHIERLDKYLRNGRDTYAALVGSTATNREWSFKAAAQEVIYMLKPLCEKRGIQIELGFPEISLPCPKAALQLALHNLISNSIKHHFVEDDTPEKHLITVIALSDYTHIDIKVQDNGPGIPRHVEEKLFDFGDSFMQASNREGKEESHGIGLWLTQKLMAKFEGELQYKTALGVGTTFTLRLPFTIGMK